MRIFKSANYVRDIRRACRWPQGGGLLFLQCSVVAAHSPLPGRWLLHCAHGSLLGVLVAGVQALHSGAEVDIILSKQLF